MNRGRRFLPSIERKVERYPVLSIGPWRHFYEYSRRECFIGIPAMILRDISDSYRVKMYNCVFKERVDVHEGRSRCAHRRRNEYLKCSESYSEIAPSIIIS